MTITRRIFDESKQYFGRKYHSLKELFDWDVNEDWDEILFKDVETNKLFRGEFCFLRDDVIGGNGKSFYCSPLVSPSTTNFTIRHGFAVVSGREVSSTLFDSLGSTFEFTSTNNYIVSGKVSSIAAITPSVQYTFNDSSQLFEDISSIFEDAGGNPFRIRMTSGAASGSTFTVDGLLSDTSLRVDGNLSGVVAGDTYKLLPPALTVPVSSQTDHIYLCEYRHTVDERLDADLEDPTLNVVPSARVQSRWFIAPNWVDGTSINPLEGTVCYKIATITRSSGETINSTTLVNEELDYFYASQIVAEKLDSHADVLTAMDSFPAAYTPVIVEANYGDTGVVVYDGVYKKQTLDETVNSAESTFPLDSAERGWRAYSVNTSTGVYTEHARAAASNTPLDVGSEYNILTTVRSSRPIATDQVKHSMGLDARSSFGFAYYTRFVDPETLYILPGQLTRSGRSLVMPFPVEVDVTDSANWLTGTVNVNAWSYIYAKPTSNLSRTLDIFLSEEEPNFDGRYQDISSLHAAYGVYEAFCVGIFYIQEIASVKYLIQSSSDGELVVFHDETPFSIEIAAQRTTRVPALVEVTATGSTDFTLQPPACLSPTFLVYFESIKETSGTVYGKVELYATGSALTVSQVTHVHSHTAQLSQRITLPKVYSDVDYGIELDNTGTWTFATGDSCVLYSSIKYSKDFWIPTYRI